MNRPIKNQQSFGFFSNLTKKNEKNDKVSNRIDAKSIAKKLLQQIIICMILFFVIVSMKAINTETTNGLIEEVSYRLNQEFNYKSNYHMAMEWGKGMILKGESALEVINFGEYSQRSFVVPMEGSIVANFNEVDSNSGKPLKGIIIEGVEGTEVVAADEGVVIEVSSSQGSGHYIFIKHRGEYISVYKHLQSSDVEVNTKVVKGELIGVSSGKLLFEVWQRKEAIDPLQFMNLEEVSL